MAIGMVLRADATTDIVTLRKPTGLGHSVRVERLVLLSTHILGPSKLESAVKLKSCCL